MNLELKKSINYSKWSPQGLILWDFFKKISLMWGKEYKEIKAFENIMVI